MKKLIPLIAAAALALATVLPALADQPPGHHQQGGQQGYEGQPGNQNSGGN
jgi:hypothetical protein